MAVPIGATTGNVVVSANGMVTNGLPFTVTDAPVVTSVSPASGRAGTLVAISGARFGPASVTNVVKFNDQPATMTSWSDTVIGAIVPIGALPGSATVSVVSAGVPSVATPGASFSITCCGTVPYITAITTNRGLNWALPGETGTLVISGGNLLAAINTISIGNTNPGVSMIVQSVSADGTSLTASYTVLPGAPAGTSLVAVSLLSGASNSLVFYVSQPMPPTIVGNQQIWYLGGARQNDNCGDGSLGSRCYYSFTQLAAVPAPGGVVPSLSAPAIWSVPSPYVNWNCLDAACGGIEVRVAYAPQPMYGVVTAQVAVGGVASAPFPITLDWPAGTPTVRQITLPYDDPAHPDSRGYWSYNTLRLVSGSGENMGGIDIHEEFLQPNFESCIDDKDIKGWRNPVEKLGFWTTETPGAEFLDEIYMYAPPTVFKPDPLPPPQEGPVGSTAISFDLQFIYVGSKDTTNPGKYFAAWPNMQVRYLDHGSDEVSVWTCPLK